MTFGEEEENELMDENRSERISNSPKLGYITRKDIRLCQVELEETVLQKDYYSAGIVQGEKLLANSQTPDSKVDLQSIASVIRPLFKSINNDFTNLGPCIEINLTFAQESLFLRRLNAPPNSRPNFFWLVLSMNPTIRFFKRNVNNLSDFICSILFGSRTSRKRKKPRRRGKSAR